MAGELRPRTSYMRLIRMWAYIFLAPYIVLTSVFFVYPFVQAFILASTSIRKTCRGCERGSSGRTCWETSWPASAVGCYRSHRGERTGKAFLTTRPKRTTADTPDRACTSTAGWAIADLGSAAG